MKRNSAISKLVVISGLLLLFSSPVIAGYGPGDGTGNDGDGPQDGTGNGPGDCFTMDNPAVSSLLLAGNGRENKGSGNNGGYGPGDGTGNDGDGPQDGTGNGPGDCDTV